MKPILRFLSVLAALVSVLAPGARALSEAEATAGRLVLRRAADAVVAVKVTVVLRVSVNGRHVPPTESNVDINGTMITPEGVTVTSLNAVDPKMIFETLRSQMGPVSAAELEGSEIKAVRLRLADGREVPGRLLAKDPSRDIALFGPAEAAPVGRGTLPFLDLREAPESATVLGTCFHLTRTGEAMQRAALIRPGAIIAILERPSRRFVVSTEIFADGIGCPVFDGQGRVLGICLHLVVDGLAKGAVVVPSAEVAQQVAEQLGGQ